MFPIRCATVVELRLQQMGEKPHFTMENFKSREAVKWGSPLPGGREHCVIQYGSSCEVISIMN